MLYFYHHLSQCHRMVKPAPRILLTNDDGIHAPGLKVLEDIAKTISDDIWVVAPEQEQSGASHSLTLHMPVRLKQYDERRFSVTGTPTDCVLFAKQVIMPENPPELVLSGVNVGSNVGDDVTYSGTVAGAMEAALLNIPAIALSQLFENEYDVEQWETTTQFASDIVKKLLAIQWPDGVFMNINFPAVPAAKVKGIKLAPQGKRVFSVNLHERMDPKHRRYFWIGGERNNKATPDSDVEFLGNGYITVTPLQLDLTHHTMLSKMQELFN